MMTIGIITIMITMMMVMVIIITLILVMMMMTTTTTPTTTSTTTKTATLKDSAQDWGQSPHCAANTCARVVMWKSSPTHSRLSRAACCVPRGRRNSLAGKFDRVDIAFSSALFHWLKS